MRDYLLQIGSSTNAVKARRALASEGIPVTLSKQTHDSSDGCHYSLRISDADLLRATLVLRERGIPYRVGT